MPSALPPRKLPSWQLLLSAQAPRHAGQQPHLARGSRCYKPRRWCGCTPRQSRCSCSPTWRRQGSPGAAPRGVRSSSARRASPAGPARARRPQRTLRWPTPGSWRMTGPARRPPGGQGGGVVCAGGWGWGWGEGSLGGGVRCGRNWAGQTGADPRPWARPHGWGCAELCCQGRAWWARQGGAPGGHVYARQNLPSTPASHLKGVWLRGVAHVAGRVNAAHLQAVLPGAQALQGGARPARESARSSSRVRCSDDLRLAVQR